jgi:CBS domain containing-hemolysin-like protein
MEYIPLIALTLALSALFSGLEIAFLTANKLQIELDNKQGSFAARLLSGFLRNPARFIGTMLVGNNIVLVMYGIFTAELIEPLLQDRGLSEWGILLWQTLISALIILFVGEFIPKTLFRLNSDFVIRALAVPAKGLYYVLWSPMMVMVGISEWILRYVFRAPLGKQEINFGRVDLNHYVREIADSVGDPSGEHIENEITFLQNALDFSKLKARDCMVPRTEIAAVEIETPVDALKKLFVETGYSRVLIFRDSIDNIIGYVNSVELFNKPDSIKRLIVPVIIIPESMSAREVLQLFIKQNKSIAVVVDEFGGTSGMLTIEDIIEEIFGDIEDEHDTDDFIEENTAPGTYLFSARLEIDYINEKYGLDIPESDEYETLAGYILHRFAHIPQRNAVVETDHFRITIIAVSDVRIETVKLEVL